MWYKKNGFPGTNSFEQSGFLKSLSHKIYHYLKHLQRFRSEFRTEKLCVTLRKLCVTLRLKSARQKYKNVLSIGIYGTLLTIRTVNIDICRSDYDRIFGRQNTDKG